MKLRRRNEGLSALFDALLFFMIILAATGALFRWASGMTAGTTEDLATRDLGRYVADIHSSALACDVGPVNYSKGAAIFSFTGSVHDCLRTILISRDAGIGCDIEGPVDAVRSTYALLVEKPLHFKVRASAGSPGPDLLIAEKAKESRTPGAIRWTSSVPLIVNGSEGELTLYIWR